MTDSEIIKTFLDYLREVESECNINEDIVRECDKQTQDVLHRLEQGDDSYHVRGKLTNALQSVRRSRRVAKNVVECKTPVVSFVKDHKDLIHQLENLLGKVRTIERKQSNRVYANRTDIIHDTLGE